VTAEFMRIPAAARGLGHSSWISRGAHSPARPPGLVYPPTRYSVSAVWGEVYRALHGPHAWGREGRESRSCRPAFYGRTRIGGAPLFEREARTLATFNHPHIGAIYGVEEANGVRRLGAGARGGPDAR